MEIRSKRAFFARWEAGELGNRTRLWRDVAQCVAEATRLKIREIGFREIRPIGTTGAGKWQKVPLSEVQQTAAQWRAEGRIFMMDDGVPDEHRQLQGEIVRTERGLEGFLDLQGKLPMRPAMAAGHMRHYGYLETKLLLERFMDPSSRDDLEILLERYPDHAIEFSCFSVNVGVIPRRRTVFWEVRAY